MLLSDSHSACRFVFPCVQLFAWVLWDCIVDSRLRPADQDLWVELILPVYRGSGCLLLVLWCAGFSLYIWDRYRINYPFLLDIDVRSFVRAGEVLDAACNATILYLLNFLLYFKLMRGDFPNWLQAGWLPILYLAYLAWKIIPWGAWLCSKSTNGGGSSGPLSASIRCAPVYGGCFHVAVAPFGRVTFLTGLLGDVWTSMVKVSVDLAYAGCLLLSGDWLVDLESLPTGPDGKLDTCFQSPFFKRAIIPLLSALPLWLRFMQCLKRYVNTRKRWPHIGNACKYALAHSVILFGVYNSARFQQQPASDTYKAAWILCMVASTLYTFSWDVLMDWGLGDRRHGFLREELLFPAKPPYYAAILVDLFMRFAWTLTLIPQGEDSPFPPDFLFVRTAAARQTSQPELTCVCARCSLAVCLFFLSVLATDACGGRDSATNHVGPVSTRMGAPLHAEVRSAHSA